MFEDVVHLISIYGRKIEVTLLRKRRNHFNDGKRRIKQLNRNFRLAFGFIGRKYVIQK